MVVLSRDRWLLLRWCDSARCAMDMPWLAAYPCCGIAVKQKPRRNLISRAERRPCGAGTGKMVMKKKSAKRAGISQMHTNLQSYEGEAQ